MKKKAALAVILLCVLAAVAALWPRSVEVSGTVSAGGREQAGKLIIQCRNYTVWTGFRRFRGKVSIFTDGKAPLWTSPVDAPAFHPPSSDIWFVTASAYSEKKNEYCPWSCHFKGHFQEAVFEAPEEGIAFFSDGGFRDKVRAMQGPE